MISVTCKCIPTTVNKELHKNEHSHEMTRFWNRNHCLVFTAWTGTDLRIIPWIGLRIACVSDPQRARIRIESGSPATVWISPNKFETLYMQPKHTKKYKYTLNTHPSTPTHTCTPTYIHIHTYIRVYTYIHSSTHACVHKYKYIHTLIHVYMLIYIHTSIHTYIYIPTYTHELKTHTLAHPCIITCIHMHAYHNHSRTHQHTS